MVRMSSYPLDPRFGASSPPFGQPWLGEEQPPLWLRPNQWNQGGTCGVHPLWVPVSFVFLSSIHYDTFSEEVNPIPAFLDINPYCERS